MYLWIFLCLYYLRVIELFGFFSDFFHQILAVFAHYFIRNFFFALLFFFFWISIRCMLLDLFCPIGQWNAFHLKTIFFYLDWLISPGLFLFHWFLLLPLKMCFEPLKWTFNFSYFTFQLQNFLFILLEYFFFVLEIISWVIFSICSLNSPTWFLILWKYLQLLIWSFCLPNLIWNTQIFLIDFVFLKHGLFFLCMSYSF